MKLALFTVSFAGFWGQHRLGLEEAIDKAAELGYDGVEIMGKRPHLAPIDWSVDDCRRLRERVARRKLHVAAVAGYTNFTAGADSAEIPFLEMQIAYVEELARRSQALGCELLRLFTARETPGMLVSAQWLKTVDALRQCCDRAARYGQTIGIQNHHDIACHTRALVELVKQVDRPNIIPMVDCWSLHVRGEPIAPALAMAAKPMRFTTVADYLFLERTRLSSVAISYPTPEPPFTLAVPMGEGDLDHTTFFRGLDKAGFTGWVSYEMCSPLRDGGSAETLDRYGRQFLAYMRKGAWRRKRS